MHKYVHGFRARWEDSFETIVLWRLRAMVKIHNIKPYRCLLSTIRNECSRNGSLCGILKPRSTPLLIEYTSDTCIYACVCVCVMHSVRRLRCVLVRVRTCVALKFILYTNASVRAHTHTHTHTHTYIYYYISIRTRVQNDTAVAAWS
jgi:hypothetical protein